MPQFYKSTADCEIFVYEEDVWPTEREVVSFKPENTIMKWEQAWQHLVDAHANGATEHECQLIIGAFVGNEHVVGIIEHLRNNKTWLFP